MIWRLHHLHVVSYLVYDSSLLILSMTHPIHLPSLRHTGLFTSSDSLTLISDLTSWLVPLIVTRHGLWLILYGLVYIRSSTYPPCFLALSLSILAIHWLHCPLSSSVSTWSSRPRLNHWTIEPTDTLCSRRAVCPCQDITVEHSQVNIELPFQLWQCLRLAINIVWLRFMVVASLSHHLKGVVICILIYIEWGEYI